MNGDGSASNKSYRGEPWKEGSAQQFTHVLALPMVDRYAIGDYICLETLGGVIMMGHLSRGCNLNVVLPGAAGGADLRWGPGAGGDRLSFRRSQDLGRYRTEPTV